MPRLETGGPTSTHSVERALNDKHNLLSNRGLKDKNQTHPTDTAHPRGLQTCPHHRAVKPCMNPARRCSCTMQSLPPQNRLGTSVRERCTRQPKSRGLQPPDSLHPLRGGGFQIETSFPGCMLRTTQGYRLQRLRRTHLTAPKGQPAKARGGTPGTWRGVTQGSAPLHRLGYRRAPSCGEGGRRMSVRERRPKGTTTDPESGSWNRRWRT